MGLRLVRGLHKSGKTSPKRRSKDKEAVTEIWGRGSKVRLILEHSRNRKQASVTGTQQSKKRTGRAELDHTKLCKLHSSGPDLTSVANRR